MLLVLALTPFTGQMLATWARGSEATGFVELATRGLGVLHKDLRRAIVGVEQGGAERSGAVFRGNEVSLSFLAATGAGRGQEGIQVIAITIDDGADGRALVRRSAPFDGVSQRLPDDPVVLLSGPFEYRFSYHSRKGRQTPAWADPHELPARVELAIVGPRGPIFGVPLEFSVPASLSAACLADRNLRGCPGTPPQEEDIERWRRDFGYTGDGQ